MDIEQFKVNLNYLLPSSQPFKEGLAIVLSELDFTAQVIDTLNCSRIMLGDFTVIPRIVKEWLDTTDSPIYTTHNKKVINPKGLSIDYTAMSYGLYCAITRMTKDWINSKIRKYNTNGKISIDLWCKFIDSSNELARILQSTHSNFEKHAFLQAVFYKDYTQLDYFYKNYGVRFNLELFDLPTKKILVGCNFNFFVNDRLQAYFSNAQQDEFHILDILDLDAIKVSKEIKVVLVQEYIRMSEQVVEQVINKKENDLKLFYDLQNRYRDVVGNYPTDLAHDFIYNENNC